MQQPFQARRTPVAMSESDEHDSEPNWYVSEGESSAVGARARGGDVREEPARLRGRDPC